MVTGISALIALSFAVAGLIHAFRDPRLDGPVRRRLAVAILIWLVAAAAGNAATIAWTAGRPAPELAAPIVLLLLAWDILCLLALFRLAPRLEPLSARARRRFATGLWACGAVLALAAVWAAAA